MGFNCAQEKQNLTVNGYAFGKNTQIPVSKRVLLAIKLNQKRYQR